MTHSFPTRRSSDLATSDTPAEIAEGVTDMQVTYKVGTAPSYVPAASGLAWKQVTAVHAQIEFEEVRGALTKNDTEGTDNQVLTHSLDYYILLRNHQDTPLNPAHSTKHNAKRSSKARQDRHSS